MQLVQIFSKRINNNFVKKQLYNQTYIFYNDFGSIFLLYFVLADSILFIK